METHPTGAAAVTPLHRSIWKPAADDTACPPLNADLDVDIAIVGAGITGITTAALLAQAGLRVAVLEASRIGAGTTGLSTGNLYATVDHYLHKLGDKWGEKTMAQVAHSRRMAVELVERNIRDYRLACDFSRQPWTLYSTALSPASDAAIEREYQAAQKAGLAARITNDLPLPYHVDKALVISDQAQFHPLKYVRQLASAIYSERCRIFEHTPVVAIDGDKGTVSTAQHTVTAQYIVLATHTPIGFNAIQTELGPYREYAVAAPLQQEQLPGGIFWSAGPEKHSIRRVEIDGKPYVLIIGETHKTGQNDNPEAAYRTLEAVLQTRFAIGDIAFRWSAQQYRPADGLPYIGASIGSARVLLASGFAADGLTYGTLAASVITDVICGKPNPFADLYSPRRFTPVKSATMFLKENLNVAGYYVKDYVKGQKAQVADLQCDEGRVVDANGEKLAVYRDSAGQLHAVSAICTHMKCIVHWNGAERSWDCPCHGSRFSQEGAVLEGPALAPLQARTVPPDDAAQQ